jgi:hypothetical protein
MRDRNEGGEQTCRPEQDAENEPKSTAPAGGYGQRKYHIMQSQHAEHNVGVSSDANLFYT